MRIFYVYVIFRLNGVPCYVGKGKGYRWAIHDRMYYWDNIHLSRIVAKYGPLPRVKIRENLTESEAFAIEMALIKVLGRVCDGGVLVNETLGGEGISGLKHSEESKKKISAARVGKKKSSETRQNMSVARKSRTVQPHITLHSAETKEKQRQA